MIEALRIMNPQPGAVSQDTPVPRPPPPALETMLRADAPVRRRGFLGLLGGSGLAGVVAAALPSFAAQGAAEILFQGGRLMLDQVTHATFAAVLGSAFRLETTPGQVVSATLFEARELVDNRPASAAVRQPFSLLFRLPPGVRLPQRIYALEHDQLGRLDIFLVPVRQEAEGLVLEAIFN